jgi:hypothetical protein
MEALSIAPIWAAFLGSVNAGMIAFGLHWSSILTFFYCGYCHHQI